MESLFKLVAENLATHGSFRLYVTPPQTDLNPSLTFWKSKLAPASLIHFAHGDSSPGLIQSLLDGAADYPVPGTVITPATADVDEEGPAVEIEAERSRYQSASASSKVPDEERKTPKWFRLGK